MVTTHGITSAVTYYENAVQQKKDGAVKEKSKVASEQVVKSSEDKLSSWAKTIWTIFEKHMEIMILLSQMQAMIKERYLTKVIRNFRLFFLRQN